MTRLILLLIISVSMLLIAPYVGYSAKVNVKQVKSNFPGFRGRGFIEERKERFERSELREQRQEKRDRIRERRKERREDREEEEEE